MRLSLSRLMLMAAALMLTGCGTTTVSSPTGFESSGVAPGQWLSTSADGSIEYGGSMPLPNTTLINASNELAKTGQVPSSTFVLGEFAFDSNKDVMIEGVDITLNETGHPTHIQFDRLSAIISEPLRAEAKLVAELRAWIEEPNETQRRALEAAEEIAPGFTDLLRAVSLGGTP